MLRKLSRALRKFDRPRIVHLKRGRGYDYTYTLNHTNILDSPLAQGFVELVNKLVGFHVDASIHLLCGLIDEHVTGEVIHYLFAMLRDVIVEKGRSPWSALYTPLGDVGDGIGEFPLHCDLYVPEMLLNIFDDVPSDGTGATVLLETRKMLEIIRQIDSFPASTVRSIRRCLTMPSRRDRFNWFYNVLHGPEHPWTNELNSRMQKELITFRLTRGDGYLIHDRAWLHGREAPSTSVSTKRIHRLVFDVLSSRAG
jgi:hypothetical protein